MFDASLEIAINLTYKDHRIFCVHHLMTGPLGAAQLEVIGGVWVFKFEELRDRRKEEGEREREKNAKWKIPLPFLPPVDPLPNSNFNAYYVG